LKHGGAVHSADFEPDPPVRIDGPPTDPKLVLTASEDGTARLWDVASGKEMAPPMKHEAAVTVAGFLGKGLNVLTCCRDGTARIGDGRTGKPLSAPLKHEGEIVHPTPFTRLWTPGPVFVYRPGTPNLLTLTKEGTARRWNPDGQPLGPPLKYDSEVAHVTT